MSFFSVPICAVLRPESQRNRHWPITVDITSTGDVIYLAVDGIGAPIESRMRLALYYRE